MRDLFKCRFYLSSLATSLTNYVGEGGACGSTE